MGEESGSSGRLLKRRKVETAEAKDVRVSKSI